MIRAWVSWVSVDRILTILSISSGFFGVGWLLIWLNFVAVENSAAPEHGGRKAIVSDPDDRWTRHLFVHVPVSLHPPGDPFSGSEPSGASRKSSDPEGTPVAPPTPPPRFSTSGFDPRDFFLLGVTERLTKDAKGVHSIRTLLLQNRLTGKEEELSNGDRGVEIVEVLEDGVRLRGRSIGEYDMQKRAVVRAATNGQSASVGVARTTTPAQDPAAER